MAKIFYSELPKDFDVQGHRGCRGILPENSIPAFKKALELKVTTLEMDLVISKDKKIVVSHEPFFNHEITLTPEGNVIPESEEKSFNLYKMNYDEIIHFDCGTKVHPRFATQEKIKTHKPLFEEVIKLAEEYSPKTGIDINYNVEIKSTPEGDNIFHPEVEEFSDLVCKLIEAKKIKNRTLIQSFDIRSLQYIQSKYKNFQLSLLVENDLPPQFNIKLLGFTPAVYSPDYKLVDNNLLEYARSINMKVIPWTVNTSEEIQNLIDLGVDGIITDYPNIFE